ncbi:MAG: RNA polymerase sigma factor [Bacteroidales bacterium]|jgi:RNA polymerase sigma-70 factor (ECF subfamily)|nr:RNA polymerase sigma factor [Bacteroidales bacterium]
MTALEFNYQLTGVQKYLEIFAKQLTGNEDDAKDLMQETFLKALVYREKYVNQNNFKAWVHTIMKNIFINNYRRNKRTKTFIDQTDNLYFLNTGPEMRETNPESMLAAKELQKGIDSLDKDFRRAFDLYNEGYKYKEIADDLNLTIGTVKSRIFYSRKKLMENLKEYNPA